jgi:endonuclease/exonuclease/phosphatase family metal-dependent hydrolase
MMRLFQVSRAAAVVEATAVFVFFYQALRVLFSTLFGLIYDALFAGTASMATVGGVLTVVILALLAPLAAPRQPSRRRIALAASAVLVFLARIPVTLNDPQIRLVASILIVAGMGVYLAGRLRAGPRDVVRALVLALIVDQLLRAAGHTWDVTLRAGWLWGQVGVSLGLCLLAAMIFWQRPKEDVARGAQLGLLGGLAWGGWLFLETSLLAFPNALARWTGEPYFAIAALLLAFTSLPLWTTGHWIAPRWRDRLIYPILFLSGLALMYFAVEVLAYWALAAIQYVLLCLPYAFFSSLRNDQDHQPGWGLALGGIMFLVLSFASAFTFTYPYTLTLFRNMGLPVFLLAGILVALPIFRISVPKSTTQQINLKGRLMMVAGVVAVVIVVAISLWPQPLHQAGSSSSLRIATYNIHYGYDTYWHLSLEEQAQAIEASGAGVVMLQEVDTGRPTSYMIDDALWLSHRLGMEAVYLPTVEHLTGIALLSHYPVLDSETLLLPSELEQTGIIWARLDVGGTPLNAFATWLGLEPEERARQIDAALPFIAAHPGPAVFGGDFNSTPDSPVYARIQAAGQVDPFAALGLGSPPTDPAINPEKRIDFLWLRELEPVDARVLDSLASDHRAVAVEVVWP